MEKSPQPVVKNILFPVLLCCFLLIGVKTKIMADSIGSIYTIDSVSIDPQNPRIIYAGLLSGFYKSTDSGGSWQLSSDGNSHSISRLAFAPSDSAIIYAYSSMGIVKSIDHGRNWHIKKEWSEDSIYSIAIDPNNSEIVYAGGEGYIYKSVNGGETWEMLANDISGTITLAADTKKSSVLYAGTKENYNDGIFKSTDGGKTWVAINNGIEPDGFGYYAFVDIVVSKHNSNMIYAVFEDYIYKSVNGGKSWKKLKNSPGETDDVQHRYMILTNKPNIMYLDTSWKIYRSENGGKSWMSIEKAGSSSYFLAVDPQNTKTIYTGGTEVLHKSTDGGKTWRKIIKGLPFDEKEY